MSAEIDLCPYCGSLPCDQTDTPASAAKGEAVAWWCERPDGTGFSVDIDPGHWPNLTVHRLFKDTQPHPSQQAGTAQWLSMAVATLRQIDHPEARAFLVGYDAAINEVAG